jgi:hypothetical protein
LPGAGRQFHGTFVASIAAGATNNGVGVAGGCWNCKIMPVKVMNDITGVGKSSDINEGLHYAVDHGAKVINMSMGYWRESLTEVFDSTMQEGIDYALAHNVVVVAAAGNINSGDPTYAKNVNFPGAYDPVIAVGSTDKYDNLSSTSAYGQGLDVVAPGINVYAANGGYRCTSQTGCSTGYFLTSDYQPSSGTSFAAPHVAAEAALILSKSPNLTPAEVTEIIKGNTNKSGGWDIYYGYGRVDWKNIFTSNLYALPVTASLGFSNLAPVVGQTLNASYSLTNTSSSDITIQAGLADQNIQTGQWNSFTPQTITIPAGTSKQLSFSKTVMYPGTHTSWIAINYNGIWYNAKPSTNQLVNYTYSVRPLGDAVAVSASLGFSDLNPAAGSNLDVVFKLYNNSGAPITVNVGVPDVNLVNGKWNSFSPQTVSIPAYTSTPQLKFTKRVLATGTHKTWIAVGTDGTWYDAKPYTAQMTSFIYNVRNPNIRLDFYSFSTLPPKPNQAFTADVRVTNLEPKPINIDFVAVPIYNPYTAKWNTMNYSGRDITLTTGQQYQMNVTQTLPTGYYRIWPSLIAGDSDFTPKTANGLEMYWCGWI